MKKIAQKIKCWLGFHDEIYTEEKIGYYMGAFPTTKCTFKCKCCSYKYETYTSKIF